LAVQDAAGNVAEINTSVGIGWAFSCFTDDPFTSGAVGMPFANQFSPQGGNDQIASIAAVLPPGLVGSGTFIYQISGIPTQAGNFVITPALTDTSGYSGSCSIDIEIAPQLVIASPTQLPPAASNLPYSYVFSAANEYSISGANLVSGQIPPGLSLNAGLTGTPTAPGTYAFTLNLQGTSIVQFGAPSYAVAPFTLTVGPPVIQITTPQGFSETSVGEPPSFFGAQGGTPPYQFSLSSGSVPGATLQTNGWWIGVATSAGVFPITVSATDSLGVTGSQTYTVAVAQTPLGGGATLRNGRIGLPYVAYCPVIGGIPPFTFSLGNNIPAEYTLDPTTGELSGTPSTILNNIPLDLHVTDAAENTAVLSCFLSLFDPAQVATSSTLPAATTSLPYNVGLPLPAGVPPFQWSSNTVPAGLTLDGDTGILSGTPSVAGEFSIPVTVIDGSGNSSTTTYSLTTTENPLSLAQPPPAVVNQSYSAVLEASGGTPPYTYTLTNSEFLRLQGNTISGTFYSAGSFSNTVFVQDSQGLQASFNFTLPVFSSASSTLLLTTPDPLPTLYANVPYAATGVAP
jgi:hypothetical protein